MRRRNVVLPLLLLVAGCDHADPLDITGPATTRLLSNGVEQVLEVQANNPWKGTPGAFAITSRLVNRSSAPVTLRVTTCYLQYGVDVKSTPAIELLASAIPSCLPTPDVITLQPGQTSGTLWFGGIIEQPGTYEVAVRHAVDPEFWGTIEVTAR